MSCELKSTKFSPYLKHNPLHQKLKLLYINYRHTDKRGCPSDQFSTSCSSAGSSVIYCAEEKKPSYFRSSPPKFSEKGSLLALENGKTARRELRYLEFDMLAKEKILTRQSRQAALTQLTEPELVLGMSRNPVGSSISSWMKEKNLKYFRSPLGYATEKGSLLTT